MKFYLFLFFSLVCISGINAQTCDICYCEEPINIVLIMADDNGFSTIGVNGGSYNTPRLDAIAAAGVNYTNMRSTPICTPSRTELMTGKKAIADGGNFESFAWLKTGERTIANALQNCGYYTGIVGKWQLSGAGGAFQSTNLNRAFDFGFDEYRLYNYLNQEGEAGGYDRHTSPDYRESQLGGAFNSQGDNVYGEDVNAQWAKDFITAHKNDPFFLYYPMVLPHTPYIMTPNNPSWATATNAQKFATNGNIYYPEMIEYMDMIVGDIYDHLAAEGILDNTILLYLSDNGTSGFLNASGLGKGNTVEDGIHVPLIAHYPDGGKGGTTENRLITLDDFFPTLTEVSGCGKEEYDGVSFAYTFANTPTYTQDCIVEYYDPLLAPSSSVYQYRDRYALDYVYKLYEDGSFYNYIADPTETNDLSGSETAAELVIRNTLQAKLNFYPNVN